MIAARIRKDDLVEVVCDRLSDEKEPVERNACRAAEGLEPLRPGDKGKQGRVTRVFPAEGTVLVEGANLKTRHVCQGQNQAGDIKTVKASISLTKVAFIDPDTRQRVRVGFHEDVVECDGRTRKVRVHVMRGGAIRGIERGKEI